MTGIADQTTSSGPRSSFGLRNSSGRERGEPDTPAVQSASFDQELWHRLSRMELDDPAAATPISKRLAAENNWTEAETFRAINEYKRFVYLTQRAGFEVTPSRPVDLVWHEHLMHTQHYWGTMCAEVLRNDLHHKPGRGGEADGATLTDQYGRTLEAYRAAFGFDAPAEIWPRPVPPATATAGKVIFASGLLAAVVIGFVTRFWPLVIFGGFFLVAVLASTWKSRKARADRGGCGAGCGSGAIGSSGCGDSDGGSSGDGGSDGGGCGGGGD